MDQHEIVKALVAEILATDCNVESACLEHPQLIEAVQRKLSEVRRLEGKFDSLFPSISTKLVARGDGESLKTAELPHIDGYEIVSVLGHGGMGIVYKARHLKLNRLVALKMLLSGVFASRAELERFTREAKSEAQLTHPHIEISDKRIVIDNEQLCRRVGVHTVHGDAFSKYWASRTSRIVCNSASESNGFCTVRTPLSIRRLTCPVSGS
jgi:hypothetical protein